jgi:hypothetical protein
MLTLSQDPELAVLLREYSTAGGVIDFVAFTGLQGPVASPAEHREAARLAMAEIKRRIEETSSLFRLDVLCEPDEPQRITVQKFTGPSFDWRNQTLLSPQSRVRSGIHPEAFTRKSDNDSVTSGYADAFSDPPHGLSLPWTRLNELFMAINDRLWGGLHETLDAWSWPTDWCNYFDEGHEWWGAFYWTVYSEPTGLIVTVAASASD